MERVVIGVDPHKLSATIEVVDRNENLLGSDRFTTDKDGYAAMRKYVSQWPQREWSVEGSLGVGRPLAQRLIEAGERVVDVPAKLAARARLLDTGHGRKTDAHDAHDAHSVAISAVRAKHLCVLAADGQLEALRMLVDHRDQLSSRRVQTVNRLHPSSPNSPPARPRRTSLPAGQGEPRQRPPPRRCREDPSPGRSRRTGRSDRDREEGQDPHPRDQSHRQGARLEHDGTARCRPHRRSPHPGRCR